MGKLTNRGRVDAYDDFDTRKLGHSIKPVEVSLLHGPRPRLCYSGEVLCSSRGYILLVISGDIVDCSDILLQCQCLFISTLFFCVSGKMETCSCISESEGSCEATC